MRNKFCVTLGGRLFVGKYNFGVSLNCAEIVTGCEIPRSEFPNNTSGNQENSGRNS